MTPTNRDEAGSPSSSMVERVAEAIEDAEFGYSIQLTRLVADEATYVLSIQGEEPREFPNHAEASDRVRQLKRQRQATAAIEATGYAELVEALKNAALSLDANSKAIRGGGFYVNQMADALDRVNAQIKAAITRAGGDL